MINFPFSLPKRYDFLSQKAMLFISTTNRKHDVKNIIINKKVNYTINQKRKAIFYFACFSLFKFQAFFSTFLPSKVKKERKKDLNEKKDSFVSVFICSTLIPLRSSSSGVARNGNRQ